MIPRLSAAQYVALDALAPIEPRFALTGGAALAAVYLGHRTTRDLDLFFHETEPLGRIPDRAVASLRAAGFESTIEERFETFCRVLARRAEETVVVDLVADPVDTIEGPMEVTIGGARVLVDTLREIAANKLWALVGRSELRDLLDLESMLGAEIDLSMALNDAAAKDGGFSPLVLGWSLQRFPLAKVGRAEGLDDATTSRLDAFRKDLIERVARLAMPG